METKKTLVIIPTFNEIENIQRIIPAVLENFQQTHILVVDDNSPDGTSTVVKKIMQKNEQVFLIERKKKEGLAGAYIAGFKWAIKNDYQVVCELDADFSHKPEYLTPMFNLIKKGADFVVGSRYIKGGAVENWGLKRKLISRSGSLYAQAILGGKIKDLTGGFNMWKIEVLKKMPFESFISKGYLFQIEMKHRARIAGFSGFEHPIIFPDRVVGESKMSGGIFLEAMREVWKLKKAIK